MKKYFRKFVIFFVIFVLMWQYLPLIVINPGFENIIYSASIMMILDTYLKPLLKKIMFPINVVTFGLASLLVYALMLFLGDKFVGIFKIVEYTTPRLVSELGTYESYNIVSPYSYVVVSVIMVLLQRILTWIFKKDD